MARHPDPTRPLDHEVRRVVRRRLRDAIELLRAAGDDDSVEEAVHRARRHGKEVRALVRLLDAQADAGANLDRAVRDAGRTLAPVREAHVAAAIAGRSDRMRVRGGATAERGDERTVITLAIDHFEAALLLVDELRVDDPDVQLRRGLRRTYSEARRAYERALRRPSAQRLHRWRIWTKRLWYQMRFLAVAAPSVLTPAAELLDRLGETLGEIHDLDLHLGAAATRTGATEANRARLVGRVLRWGATAYVERPSAFVARVTGLWAVARRDGPEPAP